MGQIEGPDRIVAEESNKIGVEVKVVEVEVIEKLGGLWAIPLVRKSTRLSSVLIRESF